MLSCRDIVTRASADEQPAGVGQAPRRTSCRSGLVRSSLIARSSIRHSLRGQSTRSEEAAWST